MERYTDVVKGDMLIFGSIEQINNGLCMIIANTREWNGKQ